jgi:hypothetical protein
MKRVLAATAMMAMMASLAGPAAAQQRGGMMSQGNHKTPLELQYEREKREQVENEKAYNEQMQRMKSTGPAARNDPWAGVRPSNETNAKR